QRFDLSLRIPSTEHGIAGNESVRARAPHLLDGVPRNSTIHLERCATSRLIEDVSRAGNLVHGSGNEFLPAKSGIDGHYEQKIEIRSDFANSTKRSAGIHRRASQASELADTCE